jgi:hypothetical protein
LNERGFTGAKPMNKKGRLVIILIMAAAMLFLAPSCTTSTNHRPVITSLEAEPEEVITLGSCQITCNATDPDGDGLSYEWTATGGNISGTGAVVNWTAPQEVGTYNITVVVKDGYGGQDTRFVPLIVTLIPPSIEKLIVTAQEPHYLKASDTTGCDYDVWKTKVYYIEYIASNTSGELVYGWSCDGGEISGGGSNITWTAPNKTSVKVTVTLIVSDDAGNRVSKNIVFHVPSCSCDFGDLI